MGLGQGSLNKPVKHLGLARQIGFGLTQFVQIPLELLAYAHAEWLVSHAFNVVRRNLRVKRILCLHCVVRCITLGSDTRR